jgi:hypothetical protein
MSEVVTIEFVSTKERSTNSPKETRIIMKPTLFITALLVSVGLCGSARAQCVKYEPETVTLTGRVSSHVFPGPPNYESIKRGDRKETAIILTLAAPICVEGSDDPTDRPEDNVRDLQLLINKPADWKVVDERLGKRVTVTGHLFHATTGHHRTKVLFDVKDVRPST